MSLAAQVLKPLALAVLLSFALAPLAGFFERRRVPRAIAVILTVALALASLIGIGYVVVRQLAMLAYQLPSFQERIQKKVHFLTPSDDTAFHRAQKVADDVAKSLDAPVVPGHEAMDVRVIDEPTFRQRLQAAVGPYLEFIGVGSFVLVLVLFMLINREALGDRIVQLFEDHRGVVSWAPGRGDVLDVALGAARDPTVNADDGLPGSSREPRRAT
jgi:predicted PurR-regulated permease PerM